MSNHNCYCQLQFDVRKGKTTEFLAWLAGNDPFKEIYTSDPRVRRRLEAVLDEDLHADRKRNQAPAYADMKPHAENLLADYNAITDRNYVFEAGNANEPTCVRWEYRDGDLVAIYNYSIHDPEIGIEELEARSYRFHLSFTWFENSWQFARHRPIADYRGRHLHDLAGE